MKWFSKRNSNGERQSTFCTEHADRSITIKVEHFETLISADETADLHALSETWEDLREKRWFTAEVAADFINLIAGRVLHDGGSPRSQLN
jgi:hypothetical protein